MRPLLCVLGLTAALAACSSEPSTSNPATSDPVAPESEPGPEAPPRVLGVWHVQSDFQGRTIPANLILQESEDGALTGVWESMDQEMDLSDVSYEDGVLHFERSMGSGGQALAFEGSVVDGELHGTQKAGDMEIPCVGTRFRVDRDGPPDPAPSVAEFENTESYLDGLEEDYDRHVHRAAPRDAFDVLDMPALVAASAATTLDPDEFVLGVDLGGEARAYPIGALGSSELLNDVCGEIPIAASW